MPIVMMMMLMTITLICFHHDSKSSDSYVYDNNGDCYEGRVSEFTLLTIVASERISKEMMIEYVINVC